MVKGFGGDGERESEGVCEKPKGVNACGDFGRWICEGFVGLLKKEVDGEMIEVAAGFRGWFWECERVIVGDCFFCAESVRDEGDLSE